MVLGISWVDYNFPALESLRVLVVVIFRLFFRLGLVMCGSAVVYQLRFVFRFDGGSSEFFAQLGGDFKCCVALCTSLALV